MSTVEAGGATVFLEMKISVMPQKGTALFWHNVRRNGDPDMNTQHAACPVVSGIKWGTCVQHIVRGHLGMILPLYGSWGQPFTRLSPEGTYFDVIPNFL